MEKFNIIDCLRENEMAFISDRDSSYLSSIGTNNFPYIQHRGGTKEFLKIFDKNTIGFIDFAGNKQYISVGNLGTNYNVSLIIIDYPQRALLKYMPKERLLNLIKIQNYWRN